MQLLLQVYLKELRKDACLGVFIGYVGYYARAISINTTSNTVSNKLKQSDEEHK